MEQAVRNKLRNVVTRCRKLLEESVAQQLQGQFGIYAGKKNTVQVDNEARMSHLSDEDMQYRRDLLDHLRHIQARGFKPKEALDQLIREIAFTHLNRLCAYKMMEARDVYVGGQRFREAVSRGINSNGFKFYLADHPEDERLFNTGQQELAYRHFLDWLGGLLSEEIGVLFNPNDPANRLYPRQKTLDELLALLNDEELTGIWEQDETIGWVYQYFTPKELRDQARKESQAPRNSYELAFRNQFFTPRYVVEFLTDNTLGRIWYEMRKGDTKLAKEGDPAQCRYMVRRPNEIFLAEGQQEPPEPPQSQDDLSQEELLKQPVHIPHRPKKDPRELKILDPACGSGHFLLYCFDLLLTIYEEAWDDPDLGPSIQQDYATLEELRRDLPRLILAHNLHGIDIDLRCTQIAALALWLRCQRAWQEMGIRKDRPRITRSNLVCAEPMPGEESLLEEFLQTLHEDRLEQLIRRVMEVPDGTPVRTTPEMADRLCELVRLVWEKMKLAGEAGSLLKIEEELQEAIRQGQEEWEDAQSLFRVTQYSLTDLPQEKYLRIVPGEGVSFWQRAEALVMAALDDFAEYAANGQKLLRKLFVDDAMRGFAFVDVCRRRFDVVLMNPPFGSPSSPSANTLSSEYSASSDNIFSMFNMRGRSILSNNGVLGAITPRTFLALASFKKYRHYLLNPKFSVGPLIDLGWEVLDEAQVEVCAYIAGLIPSTVQSPFFDLFHVTPDSKGIVLRRQIQAPSEFEPFLVRTSAFTEMPNATFSYRLPPQVFDAFVGGHMASAHFYDAYEGAGITGAERYIRLWWEVATHTLGNVWLPLGHGGEFAPYFRSIVTVIDWENDGERPKNEIINRYPYLNGNYGLKIKHESKYMSPGLSYGKRTDALNASLLPEGCIFSHEGQAVFPKNRDQWRECLAFLNSDPIRFCANQVCGGHKLAGYVSRLPCPESLLTDLSVFRPSIDQLVSYRHQLASQDETSRDFCGLALFPDSPKEHRITDVAERLLTQRLRQEQELQHIEEAITEAIDRRLGTRHLRMRAVNADGENRGVEVHREGSSSPLTFRRDYLLSNLSNHVHHSLAEENSRPTLASEPIFAETLLEMVTQIPSYCIGVVFGRWDVRLAIDVGMANRRRDPLAALPVCGPAMLSASSSSPATETPDDYPVSIDWDGILVDDEGYQDDIVRRVRDVLEVIWKDRADAIESEACEILGVKSLRDYFKKPGKGGFWDDHVKRYSKSRRKAPIYWLLQSSKRNYALWLYYHRLDKDILFKALLNYVEPKIQREENRLADLRSRKSAGESGKGAKKLDREIEKQEDLLSELRDFEEKLHRAADLHLVSDLNDGVVLNIAPLHELVPWKEAKKYWDELLTGKYEWSTIGKQLREKGLVK